MNKEQFFKDENVIEFINYMVKAIKGECKISHSYSHAQARRNFKFDYLSDAFCQYYYKSKSLNGLTITSFNDNKKVLDALKLRLRTALDNDSASCAAKDLMRWGGTSAGNIEEIDRMASSGNFLNYISSSAKAYFQSDDPSRDKFNKLQIRSNAGFTKIHSLIMDDFVIYDSRVAAAMGMLIAKFCYNNNFNEIPKSLSVCWLSGTRGKQLRDPSKHPKYIFEKYSPGSKNTNRYQDQHHMHAESNIKANWILAEALKRAKGEFCGIKEQVALRAIEAALFMVGYNLAADRHTIAYT